MIGQIEIQEKTELQSYWNKDKIYSFEEYFNLAEKAPLKSEFRNGKIYPMPNGSTNHALIIGSLFFFIKLAARKLEKTTFVCGSEMQVFIENINQGLYTDTSIVNDKLEFYKKDKAITNPSIIFEVLSDSTGNYDRGAKFKKYQHIPTFKEYVLIEQDQPVIDVFHKLENDAWEMNSYTGLNAIMKLRTLDIQIPLSDIYADVKDNLTTPQYKMDL